MNESSIIVQNLSVHLQGTAVLEDISFRLNSNHHLAITGASGSGKTTLARALCGKIFSKGKISIDREGVNSCQPAMTYVEQRYQFRNLSNLPDFYYQQRFNSFDAEDAPTLMEVMTRDLPLPLSEEQKQRMELLVKRFGMQHRINAPVIQFSSGEHKRFQLIKALIQPPRLLILDNPFSGLDQETRIHLRNQLDELAADPEKGSQVMLIADLCDIPDFITHIAELDKGQLKYFGDKSSYTGKFASTPVNLPYLNPTEIPGYENAAGSESFRYIVRMAHVSVNYGNKVILDGINWQIKPGEHWQVKGINGAGKSTLLSLITGDNPQAYANEIYLFDRKRGSGESIWDIKKRIGYLSPEVHAYFDTNLTVYQTIASGLFDTTGFFGKLTQSQENLVRQWVGFLSLNQLVNKPLRALSGGEQRMVLLARAMIKNPPLLIFDEPCQGLDNAQKSYFNHLVDEICTHLNTTLIYVSHYDHEIPGCITRILHLNQGKGEISPVQHNGVLAM